MSRNPEQLRARARGGGAAARGGSGPGSASCIGAEEMDGGGPDDLPQQHAMAQYRAAVYGKLPVPYAALLDVT